MNSTANRKCSDTHFKSMYHLPQSKQHLVMKPIQSKLCIGDKKFKYLPILSRYQISSKSYCSTCFGLLNINKTNKDQYMINENTNNYALHLQAPHNYPCPNKECNRRFVLQKHLDVHLKICHEQQSLIKETKGMDTSQFIECIKFVIDYKYLLKDIDHEYGNFDDFDIIPNKQWIEKQIGWRDIRKKRGRPIQLNVKPNKGVAFDKEDLYTESDIAFDNNEDQNKVRDDENKKFDKMMMDLQGNDAIPIPNSILNLKRK
eukprot:CAMPEP_0201587512 /NCGR_PEP_ID=MMETSP0190_2-20130828/144503_1 /ASSEMBLY_ACC=CAM_ASM_000263 /TAXON_ID=37353 /ORGANISM="Rosalina sp." /LENGTH=258 /DNA_ID=CAMNT_0048037705 /DNA_START=81 /DNA_END=857 /DNA_ORIENTATION=-